MKSRGKNRKHARCEEGAEAFIFDLDGMITDVAQAHADAWKQKEKRPSLLSDDPRRPSQFMRGPTCRPS
jgi:beta-phosphoglucomutase-like phosphatase (HAD superfamily)